MINSVGGDMHAVRGRGLSDRGEEEGDMKYVVSWMLRPGGSGVDNEEASRRSLAVFAKWSPPAGLTFLQFLGRLDGQGGFAGHRDR
jgi:hypothetical protein